MKTLVMIGAGHSHLVAIGKLLPNASSLYKIILISDVAQAPYSGMLPGYLAGFYQEEEILFDLFKMQKHYGFELIIDEAAEVNCADNCVKLSNGEAVQYDCLSINTGISPVPIASDEMGQKCIIYAKPLSQLIPLWKKILAIRENLKIAVVGAGSAGVEVACALALRDKGPITLFSKSESILPEFSRAIRAKATEHLLKLKVNIKINSEVVSYADHKLYLLNGTNEPFDYVFVTTGAKPRVLSGDLKYDSQGFIKTNNKLLVHGSLNIFAAGDCITFDENPLPKSGVFAVRQGEILAQNISACLKNSPMKSYLPQKRSLKILILGDHLALAVRGNLSFMGALAWKYKEFLDRKFMNKYQKS